MNKLSNIVIKGFVIFLSALWVYLFRDFFLGRIGLFPDGRAYFDWIKFYFDSMSLGQYPMWHPLQNWGYPIGFKIRFIGEFNPFLLMAYIPYRLGVPFSLAYFTYTIIYHFLGVVGLYYLAKRLFKDTLLAYVAALLMLFSATGLAIFINYCEVVLLVPGIWFFYFWLAFTQTQEKRHFLGGTFCLMIIMTTYMPFYFVMVFIFFIFSYAAIYLKDIKGHLRRYFNFLKAHKWLTGFCVFALLLSIAPGAIWYLETNSGEMIYPHRQGGTDVGSFVVAGKKMINVGGIAGLVIFRKLFSGLAYQANSIGHFFLSVFIYLIVLLSFFTRINKRAALLLSFGFLIFLFSLTDVTKFHPFLYEHVFFVKLMRNVYYMFYMAMPVVILFVVEQFRLIIECRLDSKKQKWGTIGLLLAVHLLFSLFLYRSGNIVVTSYLTVLGSFLFFSLFSLGVLKKESMAFVVVLFLLITVQPIEVFNHYSKSFENQKRSFNWFSGYVRQYPQFFYRRPKLDEGIRRPKDVFSEGSGFVLNGKYAGSKFSYLLHEKVSHMLLQEYTQHKWVAYDDVQRVKNGQWNWGEVGFNLSQLRNRAYVSGENADRLPFHLLKKSSAKAEALTADTAQFEILKFSLNSIKVRTNFKNHKFLVYNDSYHSGWRAYINGRPAEIFRANVAFKGLWLEPGENVILLRYGSRGLQMFYLFLGAFFFCFFLYFLRHYIRPQRNG